MWAEVLYTSSTAHEIIPRVCVCVSSTLLWKLDVQVQDSKGQQSYWMEGA